MLNSLKKAGAILFALVTLLAAPSFAQDEDGWYGEGSLSAGNTTGNTETTDVGLGLKVARKAGVWTLGGDASADYGKISGLESRNRWLVGATADRDINDRLFGFGRLSYESDKFTAFDSRAFAGVGLGYRVLTGPASTWTVRGGPGIKLDKLRVAAPGVDRSSESFGAFARSEYAYAFNDNVKLSNNTDVLYGENSTQLGNSLALTAALGGGLSGRVSYDLRHDTDPAPGFKKNDTATKVSLVYGFK